MPRDQFLQKQSDGKLVPFANADTLALQLELPAGKTEEKNALINLQSGIVDSFTLPAQSVRDNLGCAVF